MKYYNCVKIIFLQKKIKESDKIYIVPKFGVK